MKNVILKYSLGVIFVSSLTGCSSNLFKPGVYPGSEGIEDKNLAFLGSNSYFSYPNGKSQEKIYKIHEINGINWKDMDATHGIKLPPGDYKITYEWGKWNKIRNMYFTKKVSLKAGKCYKPVVGGGNNINQALRLALACGDPRKVGGLDPAYHLCLKRNGFNEGDSSNYAIMEYNKDEYQKLGCPFSSPN